MTTTQTTNAFSIVELAKQQAKPVINDKLINAIMEYTKSFNRNDSSAKDLFCILLSLYRTSKDKSALLLSLGETYNKVSQGNTKIISNLKDITKLADKAYINKLLIKLDMAYYYNIKEAIKLFEASQLLKDNKEDIQKDIRESLFNCYDKQDAMVGYNNKVSSKIKELRQKYNFVDIDGVTIVSNIKHKIDKLSQDELKDLLSYINTKVS